MAHKMRMTGFLYAGLLPLGMLLLLLFVATPRAARAAEPSPERLLARRILDATGVRGGLVVHLGCGDGKLTAALGAGDRYLVHGLDADAEHVETARRHIRSLGLYGKVSVDRLEGKRLPYVDNLVNLLVAEDLGPVPMSEVVRVLCPNGVAYVKRGGQWQKIVKPRPDEIDEWTHFLHDASGNAVARDTVVGPPRHYQWVAPPPSTRDHDFLASLSAMVSAGGRVFYIIDEGPIAFAAAPPKWMLVARDAFSGVLLWKRRIESWEGHLRGFRSGPTELPRRLVAVGDRVYVTLGYGKPVTALDAATGETIKVYDQTQDALEIIYHDGTLLVVVGDRRPDNTADAAKPDNPAKIWLWWPVYEETPPRKHLVAIRADSGEVVWTKDDADTVELMPMTLAAAGRRVFFQSPKEILSLDASSGRVLWRAEHPVNRRRPTWSAPTLVVYGDVVLCGDRAVEAPLPDTPESAKASQWVVSSRGGVAPVGRLTALSAATGKKLWESDCRESYNSPPDVLVAGGVVWSGNLVTAREPGITTGRDVETGQVVRTRPADATFLKIIMGHHRCYRNKATEKYLVLGRDGIEMIDLATGKALGHAWVRGTCQYGVMPCNGLIYVGPHSCACHVESLINSFNVLAPARRAEDQQPAAKDEQAANGEQAAVNDKREDTARLERGPAYGQVPNPQSQDPESRDWPTYRHDAARSGRSSCEVPVVLRPAWEAKLSGGRLSSPVIAAGRVFVADIDAHTVHALDAADGKVLWSFTAAGRVDSPPTIFGGAAIFGSADGWIYCLRAADGELAWRLRAAPQDQRIVSYDQVESVWPVPGSVLVEGGVVYAVAGRSAYLDGGMILCRIDPKTGRLLSRTPITSSAKPDILSSDGRSVFLRHKRFDTAGVEQKPVVPHLYSPSGFLDGSWWHRTYWLVGTGMRSNFGGWPASGNQVPAGRLLVLGRSDIYGFGRFNQYHHDGSHVGLGKTRYLLYAHRRASTAEKKPAKARRRGAAGAKVASRWSEPLPLLARGMLLSGKTLFVAGPPNVAAHAPEDAPDRYHMAPADALSELEAAWNGQRGGLLSAVSAESGKTLARYKLDAPPVWDGMAAAEGRLYMAATDGKVVCMKEAAD